MGFGSAGSYTGEMDESHEQDAPAGVATGSQDAPVNAATATEAAAAIEAGSRAETPVPTPIQAPKQVPTQTPVETPIQGQVVVRAATINAIRPRAVAATMDQQRGQQPDEPSDGPTRPAIEDPRSNAAPSGSEPEIESEPNHPDVIDPAEAALKAALEEAQAAVGMGAASVSRVEAPVDEPVELVEPADESANESGAAGGLNDVEVIDGPVAVEPVEASAESEPSTEAVPKPEAESSETHATPDAMTPVRPVMPGSEFANAPKRRIALINQKGGVGKTTTTVNLGVALHKLGRRVLLVDLDPQAHLTLSLGIDPQELDATMYDLLADSDRSGFEVVREADSGVAVLPADVNLAGVEAELAAQVVTGAAQTRLKDSCAGLMDQFDDVLIDCPPALGLLTINGLLAADEVIVPMQAHYLALQGFSKLLETVSMIRRGLNPGLSVAGVVLCMYEGNTLLAGEVVGEVKGFLESARGTEAPWADAVVFDPPIRRNIKLAEAPSFGQSVFDYAEESNGAKDYEKLARSVMEVAAEQQSKK